MDKKSETLAEVQFDPTKDCSQNYRSFNLSIHAQEVYRDLTVESAAKTMRGSQSRGSRDFIVVRGISHRNQEAVMGVLKLDSSSLRWEIWLPCKNGSVQFYVYQGNKEYQKYYDILQKDPFYIPKEERAVIDSFECTR